MTIHEHTELARVAVGLSWPLLAAWVWLAARSLR